MGQQGQRGFSAFVSYSHADKAAAQKLHRRLEGYRLPKHVAAQLAANTSSDDPAKLGQIFRDREDLPAAQDLSESVKAALQVSAALIVLCSPAAKASKWVAREIETFRELHPDRPILAALLEGEPEEAFPEPLLQGREPLAADLRKEGDGPRLGFLKVVAGIAGVPLDALVQRDAQRRMRRVMAVTAGAVTAMLAMAIMTFVAIQSRNEAQFQQKQADGLIGYMLTDLREDLKGVGRLDVMTSVNERAMKYYESQGDLSGLPAEALEKRAFILHAWGEDDEKRGELDKALVKFQEAHRVTEELLGRYPNDPDRLFAHAQSEFWIGSTYYSVKAKANALTHWERYRALSMELQLAEPNEIRSLQEISYAEGNLCALALDKPVEPERALQKCTAALTEMQRVQKRTPNDPKANEDLANRFAWLADAWRANGNFKMALANRQEQEELLVELLAENPANFQRKELLMKAYLATAETIADACDAQNYKRYEKLFREIANELVRHDAQNEKWRKFASRASNQSHHERRCQNGQKITTP